MVSLTESYFSSLLHHFYILNLHRGEKVQKIKKADAMIIHHIRFETQKFNNYKNKEKGRLYEINRKICPRSSWFLVQVPPDIYF